MITTPLPEMYRIEGECIYGLWESRRYLHCRRNKQQQRGRPNRIPNFKLGKKKTTNTNNMDLLRWLRCNACSLCSAPPISYVPLTLSNALTAEEVLHYGASCRWIFGYVRKRNNTNSSQRTLCYHPVCSYLFERHPVYLSVSIKCMPSHKSNR